jgi:Ca2+/Na+ antiporter
MYFSSKRSRKIKIENEIENAATGNKNTEIELSSVYRQNGVTDVQPNFSIVDTAEEERKEEVGEVEDVEVVNQNNGNSCLTNLAVVRDFTLDCLEKAVAALIPSLAPVPYPCRSTAVCLCMMCASEKARAREREKERERLRNREQEKIEKEFLLDSSGANDINNSMSNDNSNNHNKNNNDKNDNVNNKDRFSINIDDIHNNNNNNNTENDLGLSTIDINIADTPTSAFNKNENKRAWEVQNPLHEKNTKNTKNSPNNNSNDNTDNDNNNNTYSDEAYAYPNSYVPLWRAVACLLVCLFYVGLLASAIVQLCEKLSHLVGVGGSTVGATLVALGSEVRTLYRTDICVCLLFRFFIKLLSFRFLFMHYLFYFPYSLSLIFLIRSFQH